MNWPIFYIECRTFYFSFAVQTFQSGTFAIRKYEELSYPKKSEDVGPIPVTLMKRQPHYSQSSRENVTPSSGTSPSASYKEVPPNVKCENFKKLTKWYPYPSKQFYKRLFISWWK